MLLKRDTTQLGLSKEPSHSLERLPWRQWGRRGLGAAEKITRTVTVPGRGDTKEARWPRGSRELAEAKNHLAEARALAEGSLAGYMKTSF